jgi:hypothetical protein
MKIISSINEKQKPLEFELWKLINKLCSTPGIKMPNNEVLTCLVDILGKI